MILGALIIVAFTSAAPPLSAHGMCAVPSREHEETNPAEARFCRADDDCPAGSFCALEESTDTPTTTPPVDVATSNVAAQSHPFRIALATFVGGGVGEITGFVTGVASMLFIPWPLNGVVAVTAFVAPIVGLATLAPYLVEARDSNAAVAGAVGGVAMSIAFLGPWLSFAAAAHPILSPTSLATLGGASVAVGAVTAGLVVALPPIVNGE